MKNKSNQCEACKQQYELCVYDFHHLDPAQKDFSLSGHRIRQHSWKDIVKEIDKCRLLCANCHRLEHWALTN